VESCACAAHAGAAMSKEALQAKDRLVEVEQRTIGIAALVEQ
jgi:hypothetical protein